MDEDLLKEMNKVILECFNEPPISLNKGTDLLTRKAINTSISLNLLYESRQQQYKLSDHGMRVIQLGSIEKYLSELESKNKSHPTHIINNGNFVTADNSNVLIHSSESFKNNKTNINPPTPKKTKENHILSILLKFWWLFIIPIIIGIILILIQNNFFK